MLMRANCGDRVLVVLQLAAPMYGFISDTHAHNAGARAGGLAGL